MSHRAHLISSPLVSSRLVSLLARRCSRRLEYDGAGRSVGSAKRSSCTVVYRYITYRIQYVRTDGTITQWVCMATGSFVPGLALLTTPHLFVAFACASGHLHNPPATPISSPRPLQSDAAVSPSRASSTRYCTYHARKIPVARSILRLAHIAWVLLYSLMKQHMHELVANLKPSMPMRQRGDSVAYPATVRVLQAGATARKVPPVPASRCLTRAAGKESANGVETGMMTCHGRGASRSCPDLYLLPWPSMPW